MAVGPRHLIPGSSTLCSLGLPPHVGRGDAAVVRPTRSESFFDLITWMITKLRASLRRDFIVVTQVPSRVTRMNRGHGRKPFR